MKRGILGGTFDPPHIAHLIAGEAAYRQLALDIVSFVPAGSPWQKADSGVSGAEHRLAMISLSVEHIPYFVADDIEIRREGSSFMVDTVESFDGEDIVLILGADAALGIRSWHRWRDLLERVDLAVAPRPGVGRHEVEHAVPKPIEWLDMAPLDLSATDVRERARKGLSIRFYVRERVWQYVQEHHVYG
ncbi:MAG: nicotinate-nucleotide adenylyltransferase [Acidimicrobiia bacterium]|nr:nicotinate-nucleotide adenylyltransferase [Acidimicrobiia bacterium]